MNFMFNISYKLTNLKYLLIKYFNILSTVLILWNLNFILVSVIVVTVRKFDENLKIKWKFPPQVITNC